MYRNILMLYCRRMMNFSPQKVADLLGMTRSQYDDLECGNVLLSHALAKKLAKLYNSKPRYFYEAAQQLDLLLSNRLVIKILKAENERLQCDLEEIRISIDPEFPDNDNESSLTS